MTIALDIDRLDRLMQMGEAFVPGMVGTRGGHAPGHITRHHDNCESIATLVAAMQREHPEGGKGFWALRAWMMLTWQPAVLAIMAVHQLGFAPRLDLLSQQVKGATVYGYRMPGEALSPVQPADVSGLIERAGRDLRALADDLMADLDMVIRIKPVLARRLLADRVLGMITHARLLDPTLDNARLSDWAERWVAATGLEGCSGVMTIRLSNGIEQLTLDSKACCLEYRRCGGDYCDSCPKQSDEVRIRRMREHWEEHWSEHVRAG